jgi:hypothetical protein
MGVVRTNGAGTAAEAAAASALLGALLPAALLPAAVSSGAGSASTAGRAGTIVGGSAGPSIECLLVWLAGLGLVEAADLAAVGLDDMELERVCAEQDGVLQQLARRALAGRQLSQREVAGLLRARLAEVCLAATTPLELARVARALKWLPGWVWEAGAPWRTPEQRRSQQAAQGQPPAVPAPQRMDDILARLQQLRNAPPANRAERRRQQARG